MIRRITERASIVFCALLTICFAFDAGFIVEIVIIITGLTFDIDWRVIRIIFTTFATFWTGLTTRIKLKLS